MSGTYLSQHGHAWIGCDISRDMLTLAHGQTPQAAPEHAAKQMRMPRMPAAAAAASGARRQCNTSLNHSAGAWSTAHGPQARGLVFQSDMAQGLPLRDNSIDGAISISAVQWLCHLPDAHAALQRLLRALYRCLKAGGKAVLQVYLTGSVLFRRCRSKSQLFVKTPCHPSALVARMRKLSYDARVIACSL